MSNRQTVIRLLGPSIQSVCVALQRLDGGRLLAESFPAMRLRATAEPGGEVRVGARFGVVQVGIEGAAGALSVAALSRELACPVLVTRRETPSLPRYDALFERGETIWEEETGRVGQVRSYRLACAALGIALEGPVGAVSPDVIASAWRQIEAYVEAAVGASAMRVLASADGPGS